MGKMAVQFRLGPLDKQMMPWHHDTYMQTIATNIRFNKDEYEVLKRLSFLENRSIANIIRESVKNYHAQKLISEKNKKQKLYNAMLSSRVRIDTSTVDLVHERRKFE